MIYSNNRQHSAKVTKPANKAGQYWFKSVGCVFRVCMCPLSDSKTRNLLCPAELELKSWQLCRGGKAVSNGDLTKVMSGTACCFNHTTHTLICAIHDHDFNFPAVAASSSCSTTSHIHTLRRAQSQNRNYASPQPRKSDRKGVYKRLDT